MSVTSEAQLFDAEYIYDCLDYKNQNSNKICEYDIFFDKQEYENFLDGFEMREDEYEKFEDDGFPKTLRADDNKNPVYTGFRLALALKG